MELRKLSFLRSRKLEPKEPQEIEQLKINIQDYERISNPRRLRNQILFKSWFNTAQIAQLENPQSSCGKSWANRTQKEQTLYKKFGIRRSYFSSKTSFRTTVELEKNEIKNKMNFSLLSQRRRTKSRNFKNLSRRLDRIQIFKK